MASNIKRVRFPFQDEEVVVSGPSTRATTPTHATTAATSPSDSVSQFAQFNKSSDANMPSIPGTDVELHAPKLVEPVLPAFIKKRKNKKNKGKGKAEEDLGALGGITVTTEVTITSEPKPEGFGRLSYLGHGNDERNVVKVWSENADGEVWKKQEEEAKAVKKAEKAAKKKAKKAAKKDAAVAAAEEAAPLVEENASKA